MTENPKTVEFMTVSANADRKPEQLPLNVQCPRKRYIFLGARLALPDGQWPSAHTQAAARHKLLKTRQVAHWPRNQRRQRHRTMPPTGRNCIRNLAPGFDLRFVKPKRGARHMRKMSLPAFAAAQKIRIAERLRKGGKYTARRDTIGPELQFPEPCSPVAGQAPINSDCTNCANGLFFLNRILR